jgi:hypothetical protein
LTTVTPPSRQAGSGIAGHLRGVVGALTPAERRRAGWMIATIALLHLTGFAVFILFVVPSH